MATVGADALLRPGARAHASGRGRGRERAVAVPVLGWRSACEPLDDRQHERGGLAGAGLGAGEHVATGQDVGDRFALHGRGVRVALVGHGAKELGRQPELVEGHGGMLLTGPSRAFAGPGQGVGLVGSAVSGTGALTGAPIETRPRILLDRARTRYRTLGREAHDRLRHTADTAAVAWRMGSAGPPA